jgi:hypothetical protein
MHRTSTWLVTALAASLAGPALANGIRPPRTSFAVDVTCTTGKVATRVPNARIEGMEPGKRTAELRVSPAGASGDTLSLHLIVELQFDRARKPNAKGFAPAELRRWGSDAKERVSVQVRTEAGPVRLVSFGGNTAVELTACERLDVERRSAAGASPGGPAPAR